MLQKLTEGFVDWQVGLDLEHWGSWGLFFSEDVTSLSVQDGVDTTHGLFWTLDFDKVDWFEKSWWGGQAASVQDTSGGWDDLTTYNKNGYFIENITGMK